MGERTNESANELSKKLVIYGAGIVTDDKEKIVDGKGTSKDLDIGDSFVSIKYDRDEIEQEK